MFGVVLWSDEQDEKAVIWCEDHGDLAFYSNTGSNLHVGLDAGDWVQFDMTMEHHQRFAHNPRLVCEGVYPDLADALCATSHLTSQSLAPPLPNAKSCESSQRPRGSAQILPFSQVRPARRETVQTDLATMV